MAATQHQRAAVAAQYAPGTEVYANVKGLGWVGFSTMLGFIVALIVALAYCWKKGALEWES